MTNYQPDNLERLEPVYLQQYGLQFGPFAMSADDRFVYLDAARTEKLNLLQHMTQFSNLLMIVMGENGVGKTTLLQQFVKTAQPDWKLCQITANPMMDAEQLLFATAQEFGLFQLPHDAAQLQEMLYSRLATLHRQEQTPILIIDDAHTLPKEALLAIFHLADAQVEQGNLVRIILACEPQIEKILQAKDISAFRDRVTHTMEVTAFDEDATAEYLKHRMAVAGFSGISPFTPKIVKKIYRKSNGIPLRINEQAHQLLEKGEVALDDVTSVETNEFTVSKKHYAPMVVITLGAIVIITAIVYQDKINALFDDSASGKTVEQPVDVVVTTPDSPMQEKIIPLDPNAPGTDKPAAPPITDELQATVKQEPAIPATPAAPTAIEEQIIVDIRDLEPATLNALATPQQMSIIGQGFTADSQVIVSWSGNRKQLPADQVKFINSNEMHISIRTGTKPDNWSVQVIDAKHGKSRPFEFAVGKVAVNNATKPAAMTAPTLTTTMSVPDIQGETWIRQQSPQSYTLQLFGTKTHDAATAFVQQHGLKGDVAIFHTIKQNSDWYSVIYGSYANADAAQQAGKKLPAAIQQAKPWLRRFDSVQESLKPVMTTSAKPAAAPAVVKPAAKSATEPTITPVSQNSAWLWSQDPRHFTLQLLVSQQADNVEKFVNRHSVLRAKAVYYQTRSRERQLYTLVYGVYASRDQAEQAISQLPAELRAVKPHIRTFASIHADLESGSKPVR